MSYENIIVETRGRVGIIRLNRPQALNALNKALIDELTRAVEAFDADDKIGCMLITGSDKAFAAGADIKEMSDKPFIEAYLGDFVSNWNAVGQARKPVVAAVAGFALGGAVNSPCNRTLSSRQIRRSSVSPRSSLALFPASGARRGLRTQSA